MKYGASLRRYRERKKKKKADSENDPAVAVEDGQLGRTTEKNPVSWKRRREEVVEVEVVGLRELG